MKTTLCEGAGDKLTLRHDSVALQVIFIVTPWGYVYVVVVVEILVTMEKYLCWV